MQLNKFFETIRQIAYCLETKAYIIKKLELFHQFLIMDRKTVNPYTKRNTCNLINASTSNILHTMREITYIYNAQIHIEN